VSTKTGPLHLCNCGVRHGVRIRLLATMLVSTLVCWMSMAIAVIVNAF